MTEEELRSRFDTLRMQGTKTNKKRTEADLKERFDYLQAKGLQQTTQPAQQSTVSQPTQPAQSTQPSVVSSHGAMSNVEHNAIANKQAAMKQAQQVKESIPKTINEAKTYEDVYRYSVANNIPTTMTLEQAQELDRKNGYIKNNPTLKDSTALPIRNVNEVNYGSDDSLAKAQYTDSSAGRYDKKKGKEEAEEELKNFDINETNSATKIMSYKNNLEKAKEDYNLKDIAKYRTLTDATASEYVKENKGTKKEVDLKNQANKVAQLSNDLDAYYNQYENTGTSNEAEIEAKNNAAKHFNETRAKYQEELNKYNDMLLYDEYVDTNIGKDIQKSFNKNVLGGTAGIINGGYAAGNYLTDNAVSTINAEDLLGYLTATENTKKHMSAFERAKDPNARANNAFRLLEKAHNSYPDNAKLNRLYEAIKNRTYTGTAEELAKDLDEAQKSIYQDFKDRHTQDDIDAVAAQTAHNERAYKDLAWIPNAFGTVGNQVPSMLLGYATGGLGEVLGGGAMATAGTVANTMQQVGSLGSLGLSAGSSAMDQALAEGATYNQALGYGALKGATEAGTEILGGETINSLFGRAGKGVIGKAFGKAIDGLNIESKIGKAILTTLSDVAGEMTEEMISEAVDPLWKQLTYDDQAIANTDFGEYIGGILKAGIEAIPSTLLMQGGGVAMRVNKINQIENGLIKSINESKELTPIAKEKLISEVRESAENMKLGIDEEVDNTSLNAIQQAVDTNQLARMNNAYVQNNDEIAKAYEAFNLQPPTQNAQVQPTAEPLQTSAENMQRNAENTVLNNNNVSIADKVVELNKQGFNIPKATADILQTVQNQRGVAINFDPNVKGNGTYNEATRTITLNPNSKRAIEFTTVHELSHDLKNGNLKEYQELQNAVMNYAEKNPSFKKAVDALNETYLKELGKDGFVLSDEATNDMLAEAIGNENFLNTLAQEKPKLFQRIYNWFKNVLFDGNNTGLSLGQRRILNKMQSGFRNAYNSAFSGTQQNQVYNSLNENNKKEKFEIIQNSNPAPDNYHTWIRNADEIKTYQETLEDEGEVAYTSDFTEDMAQNALKDDKITVYSSYPIENGTFVTPSKMEAQTYAGRNQVFSQEVSLDDVAWIDNLQGQYAKNVDINNQTDYNRVERKQEPRNYYSTKITNTDKARVDKDFLNNKLKYSNPNGFVELAYKNKKGQEGYITYSYSIIDDKIYVNSKFTGSTDYLNRVKKGIEQYGTYRGARGNLKVTDRIRSRKRANSVSNGISGRTNESRQSNRQTSGLGGQWAQNNESKTNGNISDNLENSEQGSFLMQKDNQGRQLSKGQQEYFKNQAKEGLDKNGNLLRLYHGTPNGDFTVFKDGTYLTPNKEYADRYQSTSASSLANSGKEATNPKTFEVYAKIENPFTLDNEKARNIYINEYIKGGNALGINPYESEDFYNQINVIDWTEGEDLREWLKENHPEYDSIILDEGADIGYDGENYFGKAEDRGNSILVFNPNQIKNIDNLNPTDNEDIRYSKQNGKWQQFLDDNFNLMPNAKRNYFERLPTNEELQRAENKGINAILKDLKIPTNEESQEQERKDIAESSEALRLEKKPKAVNQNKITADQSLEEMRSWKKAGDRKVKAYQYENPEVKPFFQYEAKQLLNDLNNSIRGERYATEDEYGDLIWGGNKRSTVGDIADLLDGNYGTKLSYDDIKKGLEAIINDQGSENIAAAKRIEMVLDKRLRKGYTDFEGYNHDPSENYKKFLNGEEYVAPDKYDYDQMVEKYGEPGGEEDNTLFSLSEEEAKEVSNYINEVNEDTSLDENFKNDILSRFDSIKDYKQFQEIKQEVQDYKATEGKKRRWTNTAKRNELVRDNLDINDMYYEPISNKNTLNYARNRIDEIGYDNAFDYIESKVKMNDLFKPTDVAIAESLIQDAIKNKDFEKAQDLIADTAIIGTELGQAVQALSMIARMTPEGQLRYLNKVVNRMNEKIAKKNAKGKKQSQQIKIDSKLAENVLKSQDEVELQKSVDEVLQNIADQMETTLPEKINEWRYLAMLCNPRTHIRNIVANVAMRGTYETKNVIARAIETVASPILEERTRTFKKASADVKKFAEQSTKDNSARLAGDSKKDVADRINELRKVFKNETLERIRKFNSNALSLEDNIFTNSAYKANLEEYLTANGIRTQKDIDLNPDIVQKGIKFATEEAWKTTFHQMSKLANKINELERTNGFSKLIIGGIVPFKKTPINIAKTGAAYSPLGLLETLSVETYNLKNGNITANEWIDRLSQGLTGTAVFAIGAFLAQKGILQGSTDDDEDEYKEAIGQTKSYSVRIGDRNYDISWLSPSAMPLLMGAELVNASKGGKTSFNDIVDSLTKTLDPLSEMSLVSGINSTLKSYSGGPVGMISGAAKNATKSYLGQFVPTIGGQINKIIDDTQRTTTATKNSKWKEGETFLRQQVNKIPGGSFLLEPKTDVWGNEVKRNSNPVVRAFDALINPGTVTEDKTTDTDKELLSLFSETGNKNIIPSIPSDNFQQNNQKYELSSKEYTKFKKDYGQKAYKDITELVKSKHYWVASPDEKSKMVQTIYDEAKKVAKEKYGVFSDVSSIELENKIKKANIPLADYYVAASKIKGNTSNKAKKNILADIISSGRTEDSKGNYKRTTDYTKEQKELLYEIFNVK